MSSKGSTLLHSIKAGTAAMAFSALFLAACASHSSQAETVIVSTFAGGEEGFADGQGSAARFRYPTGIAIDTAGNLYVADSRNNRIRKITPKGEVSTLAGGEEGFADGQGSAARFYYPRDFAIDVAGNLYVADKGNNRIRKITPQGEVSTLAGGEKWGFADGQGSAARFNWPNDIAIDAAGNLYVADERNNRIRKITPEREVSTLAGSDSIGGRGIDNSGFVDGPGKSARFYQPLGIAIDAAGNLYVADSGNNRIRKVTPAGEVSTLAGGGPTGVKNLTDEPNSFADGQGDAARFNFPVGITIDAVGNLYVVDTGNHRIRKVTPDGKVSTLAGGIGRGFIEGQGSWFIGGDFVDGEGNAARFHRPIGIAIDAAGNLYVVDEYNHRIRKIVIRRP